MPDDSKRLLERYCRHGDKSAFSVFYRAQADRLWRFLRVKGCSAEDAYDLLGEAFLRFIQTICRDPRYPVALLYRIALNLHIDAYRRATRSPLVADHGAVESHAGSAGEYDSEQEYLRRLMRELPEDEQNLLLMRYWIGMSHKEIAASAGRPEGTVRRQCAGALAKLRRRWSEDHGQVSGP